MAIRKRDESLVPMGYFGPSNMLKEMERMFDDLRLGFEDMPFRSTGIRLPVVDIRDEGKEYTVEAELPGLRKEDVSIEMDENALIIKAERENQQEESGEGFVRKERGRVSFYRQVPMPVDVETSKATAKMEDGLLKITLPKKEELVESKKKLEIQ
jgi:HSP20 family protein